MGAYTIALIGHSGSGKTTLGEALLYRSAAIRKMGEVDQGTTVLDFEPDEKERQSSVHSSVGHMDWNDHSIDLIDTPGSMNFIGATMGAVRVADGMVLVSGAEPGIQGGSEFFWEAMEQRSLPRILVISMVDREQSDFDGRLATLNENLDNRFVPVTLPWGQGENFQGIVDLRDMKAYDYTNPDKPKVTDIPQDMLPAAEDARELLIESAAEGNDDLLEKYLETESLDSDEIARGLKAATHAGQLVPVFAASPEGNIGTDHVLTAITDLLPNCEERRSLLAEKEEVPEGYAADSMDNADFAGLIFNTRVDQYAGKLSIIKVISGELQAGQEVHNPATGATERASHLYQLRGKEQVEVKSLKSGQIGALPKLSDTHTGNTLCASNHKVEFRPIDFPEPVLTYALTLGGKGEEEKMSTALHRMMEEDPTLTFRHYAETGDFLIGGMGQIHLDLTAERLKKEFNISVSFEKPHVPYRETIRASSKAQGRYKKQTGGRGQYGDCWLELKPNGQIEDLAFQSAIVGGAIPRTYIPAVEKGVAEALAKGIVAGYRVIGISATVYDGSYHDVDSSEMAFKIAGSMAFKKAMESAKPTLLEPIMLVEVVVSSDYMGDVMGDINSRRGKVLGMDSRGKNQVVRAEVPMSEVLSYAIDLRSMTSGQGYFTQKFSHYQEVPAQIADKVIKERQSEKVAG